MLARNTRKYFKKQQAGPLGHDQGTEVTSGLPGTILMYKMYNYTQLPRRMNSASRKDKYDV